MNRRETLKALGLIGVGSGLLVGSCRDEKASKSAIKADKLPGVEDWEHERNQALLEETFFTEHEMATIAVLADIIIPADEVSGSATDAGVPEFIEFILKDLPYNKLPMRGGLKWLDIQSNKRFGNAFIACKEIDQLALIDDIAYPSTAKPEMKQGVAFFSLMRALTTSGFYTTEMGVKDIGYVGNRPGVWNGVPEDVLREHGFDRDDLS
jgi:hypothetical protein